MRIDIQEILSSYQILISEARKNITSCANRLTTVDQNIENTLDELENLKLEKTGEEDLVKYGKNLKYAYLEKQNLEYEIKELEYLISLPNIDNFDLALSKDSSECYTLEEIQSKLSEFLKSPREELSDYEISNLKSMEESIKSTIREIQKFRSETSK
jgi:hypothetical protein